METIHLNLARKWRSSDFDHIIGQDLAVRILKNSLYLGKFFPVYLLAGQHGCGKTTTARVFAAAVNCAALPDFQLDPQKNKVPCGTCASCVAMQAGKHPDFIEIDAASHTGVDNVRQLVETATLMPQIGRKKVYLIDEAHMLSKAAFNAFLKMLEEPHDAVIFLLATTDEHKIIETVKSRCFQLFFQAVVPDTLREHLHMICAHESMSCDDAGLDLIIAQSQGSVRDAINVLEQVFLSEQCVNKETVLRVCGAAADEVVIRLFASLIQAQSPLELMSCMRECGIERYNAEYLWRQLLELLHAAVWLHYDAPVPASCGVHDLAPTIKKLAVARVLTLFSMWCEQEVLFLRTINKSIFIQFFLVRAWHVLHEESGQILKKESDIRREKPVLTQINTSAVSIRPPTENKKNEPVVLPEQNNIPWDNFVKALEHLDLPLLVSIFKQARVVAHDATHVLVHFAQRLVFLGDTIGESKARWQPLFAQQFGETCVLQYEFVSGSTADVQKKTGEPVTRVTSVPRVMTTPVRGATLDVSDKNQWPVTHELLKQFPGTIAVVPEPQKVEQKNTQEVHHEQNHE